MRILIVDDEKDIRDSLREFFEEEGFMVGTAANGAEAIELLRVHVPCVVILDLIMPILDGGAVYSHMRSDPRLAKVAVIVSTSDPSRAPTGVAVMQKPVDLRRLLGAVRVHCDGSAA